MLPHHPFLEQQLPKAEPWQVLAPVAPQEPSRETARAVDVDVLEVDVRVDVVLDEDVLRVLEQAKGLTAEILKL